MLLEIEHLTKTFGAFTAVDDVSFSIRRGETLGLLGPNGAGKSTTIHMMLGLVSPTSGEIRVFGKSLREHRRHILEKMNVSSPYVAFPNRLTVLENLMVFARLYNIRNPRAKVAEMLRRFEIEHLRDKPVSRLSSGENTCAILCKAFLNDPELLLLDEPTAFLDPRMARRVKRVLREMKERRGTTILYTSHNMADVEEVCSRIVFLSRGRVIAAGSAVEVTQTILREDRSEPALEEVFLRVSTEMPDEVA
jgi:ABC-2 type transport system ATP-binding protein